MGQRANACAFGYQRHDGRRAQQRGRPPLRPDDADAAPRRDGPGPLGQDRVHHRARAQSDRRGPPAVLRSHGRGPHHARLPGAAARRSHPALLPTRSIWPSLQETRRSGPKARAASASCASRSNTSRPSTLRRALTPGRLHVDIVDYPGEWLLDLPLLDLDFGAWSSARARRRAASAAARTPPSPGSNFSPRSIPTARPTSRSRSTAPPCSRATCTRRARPIPRSRRRAPGASCCPATPRARRC